MQHYQRNRNELTNLLDHVKQDHARETVIDIVLPNNPSKADEIIHHLKRVYTNKDFIVLLGEKPDGTKRETSLDGHFINLMVVKHEEQAQKETALKNRDEVKDGHEKTERAQDISSFEAILQPKQPIELAQVFPKGPLSQQTPVSDRRLLIEGRAGIGKTTLSKYFAYQWALGPSGKLPEWQAQFKAVVFIRLRNLLNTAHYPKGQPIRACHQLSHV